MQSVPRHALFLAQIAQIGFSAAIIVNILFEHWWSAAILAIFGALLLTLGLMIATDFHGAARSVPLRVRQAFSFTESPVPPVTVGLLYALIGVLGLGAGGVFLSDP